MSKLKALFITCACLASNMALAGTINGTLAIRAEVGAGCQIDGTSGGTSNFGVLDFGPILTLEIENDVYGQTSGAGGNGINLTCTQGTAYTITLDDGENHTGARRAMRHSGGATLEYELYRDASLTQEWSSSTPVSASATGVSESHTVYGVIRAGQTAAAHYRPDRAR